MEDHQVEVKQLKIVKDPRLSLTQFSRYFGSTTNGRQRILLGSKYPGEYIPKYYDIARNIITATFSSNFEDYELYFDEFRRHAIRLRKEALAFSPKTDNYKNRHFSARALEGLIKISAKMIPILDKYVLNGSTKRAAIIINDVKISSKADMLLFDQAGEQIGVLKFNFAQARLKENEAELALKVLQEYSKNNGLELQCRNCVFIDVYSGDIIFAKDNPKLDALLLSICADIKSTWVSI